MSDKKDITHLLERLEAFEERMEVRIEALYAILDFVTYTQPAIVVRGEVHPRNGTELIEDFKLVVDLHDKAGRLLVTEDKLFLKDSFFGFQTFQFEIFLDNEEFAKFRIYPRPL